MSQGDGKPAWSLLVDLRGGNFPDARRVIVTGDWDATPARIREMAAEHYGVPPWQVAVPVRESGGGEQAVGIARAQADL